MGSTGSEGQQLAGLGCRVGANSMIYCRLIYVAGHVVSRKDDHKDSTSTAVVVTIKALSPSNGPGGPGRTLLLTRGVTPLPPLR